MSNTIVSLQNVTIRYPDQTILSKVNFEVKKGENWLLVGENEVFKNALIDALSGRASIINGAITYPFFDVLKQQLPLNDPLLSPSKFIAHVSDRHSFRNLSNTNQFYYQQRFNSIDSENSLTVEAYLKRLVQNKSVKGWTVNETIEKLNLTGLLDEQLIKLSNGETKRLLIAAALLRHPVMLLLTNPLAGLDVASRVEVINIINQVALSGISIVMSSTTHEIPEAITNLACFNNNNTITPIKKENYKLQQEHNHQNPLIDAEEVKALLSINKRPNFNEIVTMKDVTIKYCNKIILDNINWTVKQGERWALTGPNGAGKSTLLSLINGDNPQAFANHIIIFDRKKGSGESIWDIKKQIGFFSPELYQYFPLETTCLQAVECGFYDTVGLFKPSNTKLASISLRWMKLLGVDHLAKNFLKYTSSTEQRLCLLARALVKSPPLLILDEPCQSFNDNQQANFKELLNTICEASNVTLIYVSHYKDEIPECVTKEFELSKK